MPRGTARWGSGTFLFFDLPVNTLAGWLATCLPLQSHGPEASQPASQQGKRRKDEDPQAANLSRVHRRADDLIPEESETVQLALKRLSPRTSYDRVYRIRRATQLSLQHKLLQRSQWTKPDDDVPYLLPLIKEIEAELAEKENLDALTIIKKH